MVANAFTRDECGAVNVVLHCITSGKKDEEYRHQLGSFGISGDLALRPIASLSGAGGQKSLLAFDTRYASCGHQTNIYKQFPSNQPPHVDSHDELQEHQDPDENREELEDTDRFMPAQASHIVGKTRSSMVQTGQVMMIENNLGVHILYNNYSNRPRVDHLCKIL